MAPGVVSCDVSRGGIAAACKKLLVVETSEDRTSGLSSSRNPSILSMTFPADGSVWIGGFILEAVSVNIGLWRGFSNFLGYFRWL